MADSATAASNETLKALREKMEKERQAHLETRLRAVFNEMQGQVERLRAIRAQEKVIKGEIARLEAKANALVAGQDVEDDVAVRRVRSTNYNNN